MCIRDRAKSLEENRLQLALLHALTTIATTSDIEKIQNNLLAIRRIVSRMIELNLWDEEKRTELLETLDELANTWEYYGRGEIAEIYRAESQYYAQYSTQ